MASLLPQQRNAAAAAPSRSDDGDDGSSGGVIVLPPLECLNFTDTRRAKGLAKRHARQRAAEEARQQAIDDQKKVMRGRRRDHSDERQAEYRDYDDDEDEGDDEALPLPPPVLPPMPPKPLPLRPTRLWATSLRPTPDLRSFHYDLLWEVPLDELLLEEDFGARWAEGNVLTAATAAAVLGEGGGGGGENAPPHPPTRQGQGFVSPNGAPFVPPRNGGGGGSDGGVGGGTSVSWLPDQHDQHHQNHQNTNAAFNSSATTASTNIGGGLGGNNNNAVPLHPSVVSSSSRRASNLDGGANTPAPSVAVKRKKSFLATLFGGCCNCDTVAEEDGDGGGRRRRRSNTTGGGSSSNGRGGAYGGGGDDLLDDVVGVPMANVTNNIGANFSPINNATDADSNQQQQQVGGGGGGVGGARNAKRSQSADAATMGSGTAHSHSHAQQQPLSLATAAKISASMAALFPFRQRAAAATTQQGPSAHFGSSLVAPSLPAAAAAAAAAGGGCGGAMAIRHRLRMPVPIEYFMEGNNSNYNQIGGGASMSGSMSGGGGYGSNGSLRRRNSGSGATLGAPSPPRTFPSPSSAIRGGANGAQQQQNPTAASAAPSSPLMGGAATRYGPQYPTADSYAAVTGHWSRLERPFPSHHSAVAGYDLRDDGAADGVGRKDEKAVVVTDGHHQHSHPNDHFYGQSSSVSNPPSVHTANNGQQQQSYSTNEKSLPYRGVRSQVFTIGDVRLQATLAWSRHHKKGGMPKDVTTVNTTNATTNANASSSPSPHGHQAYDLVRALVTHQQATHEANGGVTLAGYHKQSQYQQQQPHHRSTSAGGGGAINIASSAAASPTGSRANSRPTSPRHRPSASNGALLPPLGSSFNGGAVGNNNTTATTNANSSSAVAEDPFSEDTLSFLLVALDDIPSATNLHKSLGINTAAAVEEYREALRGGGGGGGPGKKNTTHHQPAVAAAASDVPYPDRSYLEHLAAERCFMQLIGQGGAEERAMLTMAGARGGGANRKGTKKSGSANANAKQQKVGGGGGAEAATEGGSTKKSSRVLTGLLPGGTLSPSLVYNGDGPNNATSSSGGAAAPSRHASRGGCTSPAAAAAAALPSPSLAHPHGCDDYGCPTIDKETNPYDDVAVYALNVADQLAMMGEDGGEEEEGEGGDGNALDIGLVNNRNGGGSGATAAFVNSHGSHSGSNNTRNNFNGSTSAGGGQQGYLDHDLQQTWERRCSYQVELLSAVNAANAANAHHPHHSYSPSSPPYSSSLSLSPSALIPAKKRVAEGHLQNSRRTMGFLDLLPMASTLKECVFNGAVPKGYHGHDMRVVRVDGGSHHHDDHGDGDAMNVAAGQQHQHQSSSASPPTRYVLRLRIRIAISHSPTFIAQLRYFYYLHTHLRMMQTLRVKEARLVMWMRSKVMERRRAKQQKLVAQHEAQQQLLLQQAQHASSSAGQKQKQREDEEGDTVGEAGAAALENATFSNTAVLNVTTTAGMASEGETTLNAGAYAAALEGSPVFRGGGVVGGVVTMDGPSPRAVPSLRRGPIPHATPRRDAKQIAALGRGEGDDDGEEGEGADDSNNNHRGDENATTLTSPRTTAANNKAAIEAKLLDVEARIAAHPLSATHYGRNGLYNHGITCFVNTILQVCFHSGVLRWDVGARARPILARVAAAEGTVRSAYAEAMELQRRKQKRLGTAGLAMSESDDEGAAADKDDQKAPANTKRVSEERHGGDNNSDGDDLSSVASGTNMATTYQPNGHGNGNRNDNTKNKKKAKDPSSLGSKSKQEPINTAVLQSTVAAHSALLAFLTMDDKYLLALESIFRRLEGWGDHRLMAAGFGPVLLRNYTLASAVMSAHAAAAAANGNGGASSAAAPQMPAGVGVAGGKAVDTHTPAEMVGTLPLLDVMGLPPTQQEDAHEFLTFQLLPAFFSHLTKLHTIPIAFLTVPVGDERRILSRNTDVLTDISLVVNGCQTLESAIAKEFSLGADTLPYTLNGKAIEVKRRAVVDYKQQQQQQGPAVPSSPSPSPSPSPAVVAGVSSALPPLLIMHAKRFDSHLRKIHVRQRYPFVLDAATAIAVGMEGGGGGGAAASAKPPSTAAQADGGGVVDDSDPYILYAVVAHHGNKADSGHYTCYIRTPIDTIPHASRRFLGATRSNAHLLHQQQHTPHNPFSDDAVAGGHSQHHAHTHTAAAAAAAMDHHRGAFEVFDTDVDVAAANARLARGRREEEERRLKYNHRRNHGPDDDDYSGYPTTTANNANAAAAGRAEQAEAEEEDHRPNGDVYFHYDDEVVHPVTFAQFHEHICGTHWYCPSSSAYILWYVRRSCWRRMREVQILSAQCGIQEEGEENTASPSSPSPSAAAPPRNNNNNTTSNTPSDANCANGMALYTAIVEGQRAHVEALLREIKASEDEALMLQDQQHQQQPHNHHRHRRLYLAPSSCSLDVQQLLEDPPRTILGARLVPPTIPIKGGYRVRSIAGWEDALERHVKRQLVPSQWCNVDDDFVGRGGGRGGAYGMAGSEEDGSDDGEEEEDASNTDYHPHHNDDFTNIANGAGAGGVSLSVAADFAARQHQQQQYAITDTSIEDGGGGGGSASAIRHNFAADNNVGAATTVSAHGVGASVFGGGGVSNANANANAADPSSLLKGVLSAAGYDGFAMSVSLQPADIVHGVDALLLQQQQQEQQQQNTNINSSTTHHHYHHDHNNSGGGGGGALSLEDGAPQAFNVAMAQQTPSRQVLMMGGGKGGGAGAPAASSSAAIANSHIHNNPLDAMGGGEGEEEAYRPYPQALDTTPQEQQQQQVQVQQGQQQQQYDRRLNDSSDYAFSTPSPMGDRGDRPNTVRNANNNHSNNGPANDRSHHNHQHNNDVSMGAIDISVGGFGFGGDDAVTPSPASRDGGPALPLTSASPPSNRYHHNPHASYPQQGQHNTSTTNAAAAGASRGRGGKYGTHALAMSSDEEEDAESKARRERRRQQYRVEATALPSQPQQQPAFGGGGGGGVYSPRANDDDDDDALDF